MKIFMIKHKDRNEGSIIHAKSEESLREIISDDYMIEDVTKEFKEEEDDRP